MAAVNPKGNGARSTLRYNEDDLWRKIRIDIKDLTIVKYTEINPKSGGDTVMIYSKYLPNLFDTIPAKGRIILRYCITQKSAERMGRSLCLYTGERAERGLGKLR
jgi:hypothetical protein